MKNKVFLITISLFLLIVSGCIDREILDGKDGVTLPEVTNLSYTVSGNMVSLTWSIPGNISQEINRPLEVYVQVLRYQPGVLNPVRIHSVTLPDESTGTTYEPPVNTDIKYEYHAVVKLTGSVKEPEYGKSGRIYSLGQTVVLNK